MADRISNSRLNDLLIDLGRSLVQYVGESWPWTPADDADEMASLVRIVSEQRRSVTRLAELLDERDHTVDFGAFPTEYTSLHYVALDYMLTRLVNDQQALVEECEALAAEGRGDPEAEPLLQETATAERRHLEELRQLAAARRAAQPA